MGKIHLLTILLTATLSVVALADNIKSDNSSRSPLLIVAPRTDTDHTINTLFSDEPFGPISGDLWDRIREGFDMPALAMAQVAEQERYYAKHPEYINRIVNRGSRYLYHVVCEIQKRGMPMELALLPIIESAYNPRAESSANASGMWQFIPSTGKMYGLERTWWYDGRRDVVAATDAALNYLQRLYDIFGDWPLALAAYNWGDGSVKRAQAKNSARGLSTDYSTLTMPTETRNYVPKLLAIRNIIANPLAYGIKLAMVPDKPYFTTLKSQRHMDVKVAAKLAEITVEELLHLNPGYIRPVIAYKENRQLVLPVAKVAAFQKNLASYDKPLLNWQPYTTKRGESFNKIAAKYGVSLEELYLVNNIAATTTTARGQTLLVPIQPILDNEDKITIKAIAANRQGNVINHPTLETAPATPVSQLEQGPIMSLLNPLPSPTQPLPLSEKVADFRIFKELAAIPQVAKDEKNMPLTQHQRYEVKPGDTLYSIAKTYGLSPDTLGKANRIHNNQLHAGQILIIPHS